MRFPSTAQSSTLYVPISWEACSREGTVLRPSNTIFQHVPYIRRGLVKYRCTPMFRMSTKVYVLGEEHSSGLFETSDLSEVPPSRKPTSLFSPMYLSQFNSTVISLIYCCNQACHEEGADGCRSALESDQCTPTT